MYENFEEAQAARIRLIDEIQEIEAQLAERAARATGVTDNEYQTYVEWRVRACRAKARLTTKLRRTKTEISRLRQQSLIKRRPSGAEGLVRDLYSLAKTLVASGAEITDLEQQLLDDAASYISNIT